MKKLGIIVVVLLLGVTVYGQRNVEKTESVSGSDELFVNFKFADEIKVEQWNRSEIQVKATVTIDNGEGNDYFSLKTDRSGDEVKIYSDFGDYFKQKNRWDNCNHETDINYVVYVPRNATLRVKSISGDLTSDSFAGTLRTDLVSGDITIKGYNGELRLKTVSGDVDVTMNRARIDARTVTGTIYSDLDIDQGDNKGRKSHGGNKVRGSVNNGTELIVLETVSGNIYMRKG